jgi:hypothetical protein
MLGVLLLFHYLLNPEGLSSPSHSPEDIIQQALGVDIYTIDSDDED